MKSKLLAMTATALLATSAQAAVTYTTNGVTFAASGTTAQTLNFDAYDPNTFTVISNPATFGDLTFASGDNLVVGSNAGYGNVRNLIAYNAWSPMQGSINTAPQYTKFSFLLGTIGADSPMSGTITTNLGSYNFGLSTALGGNPLAFNGFTASGGEYFTGFTLSSDLGSGSAPGTTDYTLGFAAGVPEPAAWGLMIVGFGAIGGSLRQARRAKARLALA